MRVIAGDLKGRPLKAPPGKNTRPTSDKIKESVFHKLGPYFDGGICLDLFAGSGSLGIEALSRGMEKVIFIEKSPSALRIIHKNIELLNISSQCEVYRNDAIQALKIFFRKKLQFDLILIDPPYEKGEYSKLVQGIVQMNLLKPTGKLYLEHSSDQKIGYNKDDFELFYEKKVSTTTSITILEKIRGNYIGKTSNLPRKF